MQVLTRKLYPRLLRTLSPHSETMDAVMTQATLSGVIAAIATPVAADGAPDLDRALIKLARYLLDNGCDGLNVLGTTGEATSFSLHERKAVMSAYKANGLPLRTADGGHRRRGGLRRGRAHPPRRRARLCRRAGAAAVLLQRRAGRRARSPTSKPSCRRRRKSRSRFISIISRRCRACPGTSG